MAYTSSNQYLLNVVPTYNTVQSASGLGVDSSILATNVSNLTEIVDSSTQSIYITTLYPYSAGVPVNVSGNMTITGTLEVGTQQGGGVCLLVDGDATVEGTLSANSYITTSDRRFKKDIVPLGNALSTICALEGIRYRLIANSKESLGFLAQDVQQIVPQVVDTSDSSRWGIDYAQLIPLLVEAIKELAVKELAVKE